MPGERCVHGIDNRFCSICNRRSALGAPRSSIGATTLPEILAFLGAEQIRATYVAVGDALGVGPRGAGALLGPHSTAASWVVNAKTGLPTDYSQNDMHPELLKRSEVIGTGIELLMRLSAWKATPKT